MSWRQLDCAERGCWREFGWWRWKKEKKSGEQSQADQTADAVDFNDTFSMIAAVVAAVAGAGMNTAGADPLNLTGKTVGIGDLIWGTNTVA